ncbi:MAG: MFS transporter, partial [Gemmatimonadaceae bacterium]
AFCILFAEGAMADWSAVYLHDVSHAGEGKAAIGYAAFSVMMALGRTVGDRLVARFGAGRVVRVGGVAAALGIALALRDPRPVMVAIGFGAIGAGLASSFPSVLSAASRVPGVPAGAGIALASTVGYTGFLSGPPLIGFVAQATDLRGGLAVVALSALLVAWLAGSVAERA